MAVVQYFYTFVRLAGLFSVMSIRMSNVECWT